MTLFVLIVASALIALGKGQCTAVGHTITCGAEKFNGRELFGWGPQTVQSPGGLPSEVLTFTLDVFGSIDRTPANCTGRPKVKTAAVSRSDSLLLLCILNVARPFKKSAATVPVMSLVTPVRFRGF